MSEDKKRWLGLGKDSECRCLEFHTDLNQLCDTCPLKTIIPKGIETQIVKIAEDNRELMPPEQFNEWVKSELDAAADVRAEMRRNAMNPDEYMLKGRIRYYPNVLTEAFIWNKERAKALIAILNRKEKTDTASELKTLPTFEELTEPITEALQKLDLLSDTGKYIGKTGQIKTLFNALESKGYLVGDRMTTERFSKYFEATFSGKIVGRTLRNALTQNQKEDLQYYKAALPKK